MMRMIIINNEELVARAEDVIERLNSMLIYVKTINEQAVNTPCSQDKVKEATIRGTVLVQTPSIPVENEDRSVKVGNKRRYQEMVTSSNPVLVNEQSNPSIKLNQRSQSPKIDDEQNMIPEIRS